MSKNKGRISSDNYTIKLVCQSHKDRPVFNLTELFGLTSFKWELVEEEITFTPITRLDPETIIIPKGVKMEFATKKENLDDIMTLLITQNSLALGNNATKKNFGLKTTKRTPLGINLRTDPKNNQFGEKDSQKLLRHVARGVSIFNNSNSVHYVYPTYDLVCTIKHLTVMDLSDYDLQLLEEEIIFKNVKLFAPTQSVTENSSDIEETFKGVAGWVELKESDNKQSKKENRFTQIVTEMVDFQFTNNKPESLEYLNRRITNPDNKNFIK